MAVFGKHGCAAEMVLLFECCPGGFVLVQAVDVDEVDFVLQVAVLDKALEHGLEGVAVAAAGAADIGIEGVACGYFGFEVGDGEAVELEIDVGIGVFEAFGVFGGQFDGGFGFAEAVAQGCGVAAGAEGEGAEGEGEDFLFHGWLLIMG